MRPGELHKVNRDVQHHISTFVYRALGTKPAGVPYSAVRWHGSIPEVEVQGTWYELITVGDKSVENILFICKKQHGRKWRKWFEEDLGMVLLMMERNPDKLDELPRWDSDTTPLTVRRLDTGEKIVLCRVRWKWANLKAVRASAQKAWKASGQKTDPREDPSLP